MKKIINLPETAVTEMCRGMVVAHPELVFLERYRFVRRKAIPQHKVVLISGGGSGHEPAHVGYVGKGMLDAAVCGDIFASPSHVQIYQAIKATANHKGVLLIIKNYSGDVMNFQSAALLAKADGIDVDFVLVADDIAVEDSLYTVGRRGVAGAVLVHKIAGAAAEAGLTLAEVKHLAERASQNVRSIGFAFSSCVVPAKGTATFTLADDEMEYGVGIHGEPGCQRENTLSSAQLAKRMVKTLLNELALEHEDEVVLLVNGFGATPLMELYILNNDITACLQESQIRIRHLRVGNYMTSLDMAGASVSLMKLDPQLAAYFDAECQTPAFCHSEPLPFIVVAEELPLAHSGQAAEEVTLRATDANVIQQRISFRNMVFILHTLTESIIRHEVLFCELDSHAGDGDFGMSLAKGFKQLKTQLGRISKEANSIGELLEQCALVIVEYCGGASGPVWGFAFKYAGKACVDKQELDSYAFADLLQAAVQGVQEIGERSFGRGATIGDKTLIDALLPCAQMWRQSAENNVTLQQAFARGAQAAVEGAEKTKSFAAHMGRAGVVGDRSIGHPDAGAYALGLLFTEISSALRFH